MNIAQRLATALGLAATIVIIAKVGGCSSTEVSSAPPPAGESCGDLAIGQERVEQCPGASGTKTYICTEKGLRVAIDGCTPGGGGGNGGGAGNGGGGDGGNNGGSGDCRVAFAQVQPILTTNCISCHQSPTRIDEYGTARAWAQKNVARVNLAPNDNRRMPLPPREPLSAADKATLKAWVDAGTPEKCDDGDGDDADGGEPRAHIDFPTIERAVLVDLQTRVDDDDRDTTIYLSVADRWNAGANDEELKEYRRAIDKTLNSVNPRGTDITRAVPVPGTNDTLYRVDLDDYEINNAKFAVLVLQDKLPIISVTDDGALIKSLTGRNQSIYMAANFTQLSFQAPVYHAFTETPATLAQYLQQIGLNLNGDLANLDVNFVGTTTSPITNLKNRLSIRDTEFNAGTGRGTNSYFWMTFDTIPVAANIGARNLFNFPLLTGTGGNSLKNFLFDASETIVSAPNGFQLYGLWAANGARQDAAPSNIVRDSSSPIDFNIKNAISCTRCHSAGIIPMVDQVRDHVVRNASQFNANDVNLVRAVYRPQSENNGFYAKDQAKFAAALRAIDVDPAQPDPQSFVNDRFFLDWDLKVLCGYLLLELDECKVRLDQSVTARSEIGQILTKGLITYEQFKDVYNKLVLEMALFGRDDV